MLVRILIDYRIERTNPDAEIPPEKLAQMLLSIYSRCLPAGMELAEKPPVLAGVKPRPDLRLTMRAMQADVLKAKDGAPELTLLTPEQEAANKAAEAEGDIKAQLLAGLDQDAPPSRPRLVT